jgi:hypothetical protein
MVRTMKKCFLDSSHYLIPKSYEIDKLHGLLQKEPSEVLSVSFLRNAFTWANIRIKAGLGRLITVMDSTVVFDGCYPLC